MHLYQTVQQSVYMRLSKEFQKARLQPTLKWLKWQEIRRCVGQLEIPCFRVVNSKGELAGEYAFGGAWAQKELLEADGIEVINGKVDLSKYGVEI